MTIILEQGEVCDGYDVRVQLDDGTVHVFHFLSKPTDVQVAVDQLATSLPQEPDYVIEGE